jgi:hypothetical protein
MITVNQFKISNDRKSLSLKTAVGAGQTLTSITMWTDKNYKSSTDSLDLSSLISGSTNEEDITITAGAAGVSSFDGLYIVQLSSSDVADVDGIVATISLTRFYGVMSQLLANINLSCLNCNDNFQNTLLLDLYIQGIINALTLGRFRDAIAFLNKINIFAEFNCAGCVNQAPVVSTAGNIVSIGVIDCVLNSES